MSAVKRKVESSEEVMEITPLGAGNEVGRSCILLKFKGKQILVINSASRFDFSLSFEQQRRLFYQFDAGVHPAYSGLAQLPYFDLIDDPAAIDILLVTQCVFFFALFFRRALTLRIAFTWIIARAFRTFCRKYCRQLFFLFLSSFLNQTYNVCLVMQNKTSFKGKCLMTSPTKAVMKLMLGDFVKVTNISVDDMLYSEQDLLDSLEKIEVMNYHQDFEYKGIRISCYNAG